MSEQIRGIVRSIHSTRGIEPEVVFQAIEAGILKALSSQLGISGLAVSVDRETGDIQASKGGVPISPEDAFGRDDAAEGAMAAAAEILGKAERRALYSHYQARVGQILFAEASKKDRGKLMLHAGRVDCEMPKDERLPGEQFLPGASIACQVIGVKEFGERVRVQLSRSKADLVRGLFKHFISAVADGSVVIHAAARDPGYRSKVALVSKSGEDCIDACLANDGQRMVEICDHLSGERVDIIDWQAGMEANIAAALKPAAIDGVFLYPLPGKAIALLAPEEVHRARGRNGKNLMLASKLCGWDIALLTADEWTGIHERARREFREIGVESPNSVIASGIFSLDELCMVEPDDLMQICGIDADTAAGIISRAEERSGF